MLILTVLQPHWESEKVQPYPPEGPARVTEAFASLGAVATPDVIALYGALGGMDEMDSEYWRLWPLDEVRAQEPSEHGVVFSDYCISCWEYRLKAVGPSHSAVYVDYFDGTAPQMVAESLESFLEQYAVDARRLLDATSLDDIGIDAAEPKGRIG